MDLMERARKTRRSGLPTAPPENGLLKDGSPSKSKFAEDANRRTSKPADDVNRPAAVLRAVRQYSPPLPAETLAFLRGIAADYTKVKNYVYQRYAGIGGLDKLYPGYTVQNEMNASGLRQALHLPYCYFQAALFEAVGDIKSGWSNRKNRIAALIQKNETLTDKERRYLYEILQYDKRYAALLNRRAFERPEKTAGEALDTKRLDNLLRRLTRRHMSPAGHSDRADCFTTDGRAYRYKDGGIYLSSRTPFQRVFVPLTDRAVHKKPITVQIKQDAVVLFVAVESTIRPRKDYTNTVALYLGYRTMLTASSGNRYGERLGDLLSARADRLYAKHKRRADCHRAYRKALSAGQSAQAAKIRRNNLGAQKLTAQNEREMAGIRSYINAEIRRMLETEKPRAIVIPARTRPSGARMQRETRRRLSRWTVGYLRKRLCDKCALWGVAVTEVSAAYTAALCARCGAVGRRVHQTLVCETCGARIPYAHNGAQNLLKKAEGAFRLPPVYENRIDSPEG